MATAAVLNKNDTKPYENELQLPKYEDPVIIVGGGLAGLSATLQAIQEGANVVLIEGEKDLGGNSQKVRKYSFGSVQFVNFLYAPMFSISRLV